MNYRTYISTSFLILYLFCYACTTGSTKINTKHIEGYWEIEQVQLADGSKKEYKFNQNIDFFTLKDSLGIRKKLMPKLDGGFITSINSERFSLKLENDSLNIYYKTELANWKETIIDLKENQMKVINQMGNVYIYKRHKKLSL